MEHILMAGNRVYKIAIGESRGLILSVSENRNIIKTVPLTAHNCIMFSADIDRSETIHIAAVISGTLTYIRYSEEKTSTVHLMRLPEKFSITSLIINCENQLRLNYCVKSREGCAIIEYTEQNENWQGKNIYTCEQDMVVRYVKKNKNECYAVKKRQDRSVLINAYEPEREILSVSSDISCVQGVFDGVVNASDKSVYLNGDEFATGERVYALDGKRVFVSSSGGLREYILEGTARFISEAELPRGAKEYVLCAPDTDKKLIISSPFPYIKTEPELKNNGGLLREVYSQQRTLFQLSAEIKELKMRIKHIEDTVKNR